MVAANASADILTTAEGTPLKQALARATRINKIKAFLLVAPLLVFILFTFLIPIADMMRRSIAMDEVIGGMPLTIAVLEKWDGEGLPPEAAFAALAKEMSTKDNKALMAKAGAQLNRIKSRFRSLINKTSRKVRAAKSGPYKPVFLAAHKEWSNPDTWKIIREAGAPMTKMHYLNAVDLTHNPDGAVVRQNENKRIYVTLFERTIYVSFGVTILCLLLAYPISYLLATLPLKTSNLLMIMVLLPFWTSLLVRTTAWIVLLQANGVMNELFVWFGIIHDEERVRMIYNMTGTFIAMTHILLPFMVLPLYSVMKTISPSYMRAARSLGANPFTAFVRIYMPQTVPGVGAGSILVFILAIGYYITPALVGGQSGQLISNLIEYHMKRSLNWGLAAALGGLLLIGVLALYWLYNRLVGIDKMKFG
jgi:putative spermidine/putrescine transport system permease protein